jgi:hypothetical protein
VKFGAIVAFGGLTGAIFSKAHLAKHVSPAPLYYWLASADSRLGQVERVFLKLGALISAGSLILKVIL